MLKFNQICPPPFSKLAAFLLLAVIALPAGVQGQNPTGYFAPRNSNAVAKSQSDEQLWGVRVCFYASIIEISDSSAVGTVQFYYTLSDRDDGLVPAAPEQNEEIWTLALNTEDYPANQFRGNKAGYDHLGGIHLISDNDQVKLWKPSSHYGANWVRLEMDTPKHRVPGQRLNPGTAPTSGAQCRAESWK